MSRTGWASGNAMAFILTGTGTRTAEAFESGAAIAPMLHIEYAQVDTPPTVDISQPPAGGRVGGAVTVRATANDTSEVTQVQFKVDGSGIGTDTTGGDGYSAAWDTTALANGSVHSIEAIATDTSNKTATDSVSVTVDNDRPVVAITAPADGATVTADATDQTSLVAQVRFVVGATHIGTDTNGGNGWSVNWDTTTVANGARSLTAEATDAAGNTSTSAPVNIVVDNQVVTPSVLDIPIRGGSDDVEQQANGSVALTSSDLELVADGSSNNQTVGLRFTQVSVPRGASITNAYVQFQTDEVTTGVSSSLTIRGQATDNAATFTTATNNVSSRSGRPPRWPGRPPAGRASVRGPPANAPPTSRPSSRSS